jgi:hypothetical protein
MKQALGRAVRYGQDKTIHIYKFAALHTVDVDILQQRDRRAVPLVHREMEQPMEVDGEQESESEREHTRVVKLRDGTFDLMPLSWLERKSVAKELAEEQEVYTSLQRFSSRFAEYV